MKKVLVFGFIFLCINCFAQFPPAAGEYGSTAIHKDSSIIVSWAKTCVTERGYINITDPNFTVTEAGRTSNLAFFGNDDDATGYPETNMTCISLGDGGSAILSFNTPIVNGDGPDFAVFENGFLESVPPYLYFLELAFVEVSSDGINFVRFPAISNIQTESQVGIFGQTDPTQIHNFAGKYVADYGTPFDLEDIADSTNIDINHITHIKIIDVIGIINSEHTNYDSQGNTINDPWPTPFSTGGFDLNAIGIINSTTQAANTTLNNIHINVYPNPAKSGNFIQIGTKNIEFNNIIKIFDQYGRIAIEDKLTENIYLIPNSLMPGIYFVQIIKTNRIVHTAKLVIE